MKQQSKPFETRYNVTIDSLNLHRLLEHAITSYRALDLENYIPGGSYIKGMPIQAFAVLTKHDRGRSTVTAENSEETKMSVDAGHEFGG